MDLNYMLGREQHALYMAETSHSTSARMAHRAFAKAYGAIIGNSGFPHRDSSAHQRRASPLSRAQESEARLDDWESEGGSFRDNTGDEPDLQPRQRHTRVGSGLRS